MDLQLERGVLKAAHPVQKQNAVEIITAIIHGFSATVAIIANMDLSQFKTALQDNNVCVVSKQSSIYRSFIAIIRGFHSERRLWTDINKTVCPNMHTRLKSFLLLYIVV